MAECEEYCADRLNKLEAFVEEKTDVQDKTIASLRNYIRLQDKNVEQMGKDNDILARQLMILNESHIGLLDDLNRLKSSEL